MSNMALPALDGSGGSVPRLNRPLIGDAGSAPTRQWNGFGGRGRYRILRFNRHRHRDRG